MDDPATSDRNDPAVRPHHVAFTVADLTRARAWYAAAPGYELQFDFQPPGGGPAAMLNTPAGALMELFEVPEASKDEQLARPCFPAQDTSLMRSTIPTQCWRQLLQSAEPNYWDRFQRRRQGAAWLSSATSTATSWS